MPPIALWRLGQILIAGAALALTHKLTRDSMLREKEGRREQERARPAPLAPAPDASGPPVA